ncbi:MAG: arylsulfatase A [Cyclobacteriaceae bacterium]|jgi:arylsulfatase A
MNSKILFPVCLFAIIRLSVSCSQPAKNNEPNKPNIILIMADDLGMETISTYGGESYQTPNLDRLAAEGMKFQNCYSTPLCTPSRVQVMTGKYNFRNYIGFGLLDPNERTFGHALQDAGYKTCITGKWQLLGNKKQTDLAGGKEGTVPVKAGFDTYRLWQIDELGSRFKDPRLETFEDGVETYDSEYGPDKFVEFIESFMTQNKDSSFFVYYPMVLVHDPFVPTPDSPEFKDHDSKIRMNDTTYFKNMMAYMDKQVGRIVKKVDGLGIRDNTVILFIGDNGTDRDVTSKWKGQSIKGEKGNTLEAGTHVPFIANWKGKIQPNQVNENLIDFTDFFPSLMDIAKVDTSQNQFTDGISFYPQLLGEESKTRDWVFCSYAPNWGKFTPKTYVQNTEWKLYKTGEFYNFKNDLYEKNPIVDANLTGEQLALKASLQVVLDEMKN